MLQLCMARGGLTLEEAWLAGTYNPAVSLGLSGRVGTLQEGADADLVLWDLHEAAQVRRALLQFLRYLTLLPLPAAAAPRSLTTGQTAGSASLQW